MRERIDNFPGSAEQYIDYLETSLLDLRGKLATSASPAPLNEPVDADGSDGVQRARCRAPNVLETPGYLDSPRTCANPHKRPRPLEILQWMPGKESRKTSGNAPWKQLAKTLIRETPLAKDWAYILRNKGVYDMMSTGKAVMILLGSEYGSNAPTGQDQRLAIEDEQGVFRRVAAYARTAAQKGVDASAALMFANFQKFLVFCLCNVMRDNGLPLNDVYEIVRICLGKISDDYCCRVLRATVYLNQLVDALYMEGWGLRASELLLLCKLMISAVKPRD